MPNLVTVDLIQIGTFLSGVSTLLILLITFMANRKINKFYEYSHRQKDREIVERVLQIQEEVEKEFTAVASFRDLNLIIPLTKARQLARLYGLKHIQLHLQKIINAYGDGHELHHKIWDRSGYPNIDDYTNEDMNKYHQIIKDVYKYFDDIKPYQNYLRVETN